MKKNKKGLIEFLEKDIKQAKAMNTLLFICILFLVALIIFTII